MLMFLKKLFLDETAFLRWARGAAMAIGALIQSGQLEIADPTVGAVLMGLSIVFGAGDKAPKGEVK